MDITWRNYQKSLKGMKMMNSCKLIHEEFLLQRWIMVTEGDETYVVPIIADDGEFSR
ncbi:hypothetical protein GXU17_001342 [Escherichia coli]|nr:hypothetical protein [Escherichia coli]EFI4245032.1 hypothetical protein [Escherichia coli]EFI5847272.1 hypothetical protein [Escherichia coli]EFI8297464.1 hypothetical protein [Escherichia coli]EFI9516345.1 hypothetical protein [Escherichia coli]